MKILIIIKGEGKKKQKKEKKNLCTCVTREKDKKPAVKCAPRCENARDSYDDSLVFGFGRENF